MENKAIIFDLDGTLLESMYVWEEVDRIFFERRGIVTPDYYGEECSHRSFYETAVYTISHFGIKMTPEDVMEEWTAIAACEYENNVQLKPYASEIIFRAKKNGYKTAVCTSLTPRLYTPVLKRTGIYDEFDVIVSAAEFPKGKQFPDIYLHTAALLNVKPENCVMLDDVSASLKAAKAAGMKTVGVFDPKSSQNIDKLEKYSNLLVHSLHEIEL